MTRASYTEAVGWVAANDAAGDTPSSMEYSEAYDNVRWMLTVALVADLWGYDGDRVACDVLRLRGFKKPRGWVAP